MVGVRLRADEGSIESDTDLLEDGVGYVVDQKGFVRVHGIASCCFLELPFQFKVTAREVDVIFLRIDLKIDGVDPCGERTNGDHAITPDAEIGRRDPKEVQHGVLHPRRSGQRNNVRHRRLRLRLFFRALLIQALFRRLVRVGRKVPPFCTLRRLLLPRLMALTMGGIRFTRLEKMGFIRFILQKCQRVSVWQLG